MGVIQNSLNQALATIMGSVLAGKHVYSQQQQLRRSEINEFLDLKDKDLALQQELNEDYKNLENMQDENKMYSQNKFKAYLPNDQENPVWVNKSVDENEFNVQKSKAAYALKTAQQAIENKGTRDLLIQNRIDELKEKRGGYISDVVESRYKPETESKKSKPSKNGGAF